MTASLAEMMAGAAALVAPLLAYSSAEPAGVALVVVIRPVAGPIPFVGSVVLPSICVHRVSASPVMDAA